MRIKTINKVFSICKLEDLSKVKFDSSLYFLGKTDEEISLVCEENSVPENILEKDDNWRGFRIEGVLDFSLVGILSKLSKILADNNIGIFAVSTYNTDYIFVKNDNFKNAISLLKENGYIVN